MKLEKIEQPTTIPEQTIRYNIIEEQTMKSYVDGKDVKVRGRGRTITEAQVDSELVKWQELKDAIVALKK